MQCILSIGLWPLGRRVAQDLCTGSAGIIVAAVDSSPLLVERTRAGLVLGAALDHCMLPELASASRPEGNDFAFLASASDLPNGVPPRLSLLRRGIGVCFSCEERLFAWLRQPSLVCKIEALCAAKRARALDTIPIAACRAN